MTSISVLGMDYPFGVFHRGFLGYPGCGNGGLLSSSEDNRVLERVKRKTSAEASNGTGYSVPIQRSE